MTVVVSKQPAQSDPASSAEPHAHRWTRDQYYRMAEAGIIGPEESVELIDGEIIDKVCPQKSPHALGVRLAEKALSIAFGSDYDIRSQLPLTISETAEPEPDVLVAKGDARSFADHHPTPANTELVVEVADSSLAFDRGKKASMYAAAGVYDYWIVNLVDRQVEVLTEPVGEFGYRSTRVYRDGDTIEAPDMLATAVAVKDLLP
jgi:Uma2 family endonuclease